MIQASLPPPALEPFVIASGATSSVAHGRYNRRIPIEVGPDIGASSTAGLANEPRLKIRQPRAVRPSIRVQGNVVTAPVVRAIDQYAAHAHGAHRAEGDLDGPAVGVCRGFVSDRTAHAASKRPRRRLANYRFLAGPGVRQLLPVVGVEKKEARRFTLAGLSTFLQPVDHEQAGRNDCGRASNHRKHARSRLRSFASN